MPELNLLLDGLEFTPPPTLFPWPLCGRADPFPAPLLTWALSTGHFLSLLDPGCRLMALLFHSSPALIFFSLNVF